MGNFQFAIKSMDSPTEEPLKFYRPRVFIHPSFWSKFSQLKVQKYQLEEAALIISATISLTSSNPHLTLSADSFDPKRVCLPSEIIVYGKFFNFNTVERFSSTDPNSIILPCLQKSVMGPYSTQFTPEEQIFFIVGAFSDLKKWRFSYWASLPTIPFDQLNSQSPSLRAIVDIHDDMEHKLDSNGQVQSNIMFQFDFTSSDTGYISTPVYCPAVSPLSKEKAPFWFYSILFQNVLIHSQSKMRMHFSLAYFSNIPDLNPGEFILKKIIPAGLQTFPYKKNPTKTNFVRTVDLSSIMDPKKLIQSSSDLNVQLMRWRQIPQLEIDVLQNAKVLLIGAGTLGCNVARVLLGYGIKNITLVDSGRVSFSNPVRQSLYISEDCLPGSNGLRPFKAPTAAKRLLEISPGLNAQGIVMEIPMPGHPIYQSKLTKTMENVQHLDTLIKESDAIFLLTDSRESRWLPTVMGMKYSKIVINAALGFSSCSVIRHGIPNPSSKSSTTRLGCWFCQDVSVPQNSLVDRTLDQQCTVTRPGLSFMASSMAVELFVSLLHHPLKAAAPSLPAQDISTPATATPFGSLPHSINYYLSHFSSICLTGPQFPQCIACSDQVVSAYAQDGFKFVQKVCQNSDILSRVTGLDSLLENLDDIVDLEF